MNPDLQSPKTIDEYIAGFPQEVQVILTKVRAVIKEAAPEATEAIKYKMPTFVFNGNLISFAAYKKHIGLYPAPIGNEAFKAELADYAAGRGTAQFPFSQPMPYDLIGKIVKFRLEAQMNKAPVNAKE